MDKREIVSVGIQWSLDLAHVLDDWSDYLTIIQYAHNSTPTKSTTFAPQEIVFGRSHYRLEPYKFSDNLPEEYMRYMENRQKLMKIAIRRRSGRYDQIRQRAAYKKVNAMKLDKLQEIEIEIGHWVLWNISEHFVGNKQKFGPKWVGPYEVVDKFNDGQSFTLQVIPTKTKLPIQNRYQTQSYEPSQCSET